MRWLLELVGALVVAIVVYAASSAVLFGPLVERVGRLEDQVHTYAPLEGRVRRLEDQAGIYAPLEERVRHLEKNPDPIAEACASFAREVATGGSPGGIKDAMQQLGCTTGKR